MVKERHKQGVFYISGSTHSVSIPSLSETMAWAGNSHVCGAGNLPMLTGSAHWRL
jgi:hypothetical protein